MGAAVVEVVHGCRSSAEKLIREDPDRQTKTTVAARPPSQVYRLLLSCQNRRGIVARVAGHIFEAGFNIGDSRQFDEVETNQFFMRIEINPARPEADVEAWRASFAELAAGIRHEVDAARRMAPARAC